MRKSFNTTFILLGVCALLFAWYFGYEKSYKVKSKDAEEKTKQLVSLTSDSIQEMEIERLMNPPAEGQVASADFKPDYLKIHLKKTGSDWNVVVPVTDAADASVVGGMLNTLTSSKQDRVVEEKPADLATFGLTYPVLKIRVRKDASSKDQEVWIGSNTPVGFHNYAKTEGTAVVRIPRTVRTTFEKTVKDVRNKSVLTLSRMEIKEVELMPAGKPSVILKKEDGKDEWLLARENFPADTNEWTKTLNALTDAKAVEFPPTDKGLKAYGLQPPKATIAITKNDGKRVGVLLGKIKGKDKDQFFAKVEDKDTVYEINKELLEKAELPSSTYRNKSLSKFNRYDVDVIRLERGKETLELKREGSKWIIAGDTAANVDGTKVDTLLTRLQDIKIANFLPDKTPKPTLSSIGFTIRLSDLKEAEAPKDGKAPATTIAEKDLTVLKFVKPTSKLVTVDRSDVPMPFQIKEDDYKSIGYVKEDFIVKEQKTETKTDSKTGEASTPGKSS